MNDARKTEEASGLSRRDALALGAVSAAGALLTPHATGFFARGSDELKVGLVGCGGRGTGAAVQALNADPGTALVACADVFKDRLDACLGGVREEMGDAAARVRVPSERQFVGFDSYKQVMESDADVVLLCGYPHFRPAQLRAAVEAGKHVFAEKPLAVDGPGIRSVIESARLARERGRAGLVGFCWRYHAGMKATFEKVNSGAIGRIVTVHTTYHTSTLSKRPRRPEWTDMEFQMRNWWHFAWISGDHIVEQAVHSVDRLAWATGDRAPERVVCLGGRAARSGPEHGDVFDHFAAVYEYADGTRAFHTTRQIDGCPSDNTDYIYGSEGSCEINGWKPVFATRDPAGKETWSFRGESKDMYQAEHDELFASIRAGKPINDIERGATSTLMAIMARDAAYTGQTISWKDAMNSERRLGPDVYAFGPAPEVVVPVPGKKS